MTDNPHRGSTLDSFLEEEGVLAGFQAKAIREVIAARLAEAMRERKLSKNRLATMLHTTRTQVSRLLGPDDGDVTIETLQRAAMLIGCRVELQLIETAPLRQAQKEGGMEAYEFTIIASGLSPESGGFEDRFFEAGCHDATITFRNGLIALHFCREAASFSHAVASASQDVLRAGAKVERVEPAVPAP